MGKVLKNWDLKVVIAGKALLFRLKALNQNNKNISIKSNDFRSVIFKMLIILYRQRVIKRCTGYNVRKLREVGSIKNAKLINFKASTSPT